MRATPLVLAAALWSLAPAQAQNLPPTTAPTPAGLWQAVDDDTKQPTGWFLIANHDGVYSGIIAKMFVKPGEDPNAVCTQCKDDRLNHPWLGLEIVRGMKQDSEKPDKYADGTILDPRDGKVYKAMMTLSADGNTLTVRGYVGFSLLGKNVYWTRLPDSAMSMLDPAVNPSPAANAAPATKPPPPRKPQAAPTQAAPTQAAPAPTQAAPPLDSGLRR